MIHVVSNIAYILQYRSHCMTSQITANMHSLCSIPYHSGQCSQVAFWTKTTPGLLAGASALLYPPSLQGAGQVLWYFQVVSVGLRTALSCLSPKYFRKSCLSVCWCSCYLPSCHLDLKYQKNDQFREDRSRPRNLCMV